MSMRRTSDLPPIDHNSNALTNDTLIEVFDKRHFPGGSVDNITIPSSDYYDSYKYKVTGLSSEIQMYDGNPNYSPVIANAKAVHDYITALCATSDDSKLAGEEGQVVYVNPDGIQKQTVLHTDVYLCESQADQTMCEEQNITFAEIYKSWLCKDAYNGKALGYDTGYTTSQNGPLVFQGLQESLDFVKSKHLNFYNTYKNLPFCDDSALKAKDLSVAGALNCLSTYEYLTTKNIRGGVLYQYYFVDAYQHRYLPPILPSGSSLSIMISQNALGYPYWVYNSKMSSIVQPINAYGASMYVSPKKYSQFEICAECYSTNGDDDWIGLVAYVDDPVSGKPVRIDFVRNSSFYQKMGLSGDQPTWDDYKRVYGDNSTRRGPTWTAQYNCTKSWPWSIWNPLSAKFYEPTGYPSVKKEDKRILGFKYIDGEVINEPDDINNIWKRPWSKYKCTVWLKRHDNMLSAATSKFVRFDEDPAPLETSSTIGFDLTYLANKQIDGFPNYLSAMIDGCQFGFITSSQPNTYWKILKFNIPKTLIRTDINKKITITPFGGSISADGIFTNEVGIGRFVKNTITDKTFYVNPYNYLKITDSSTGSVKSVQVDQTLTTGTKIATIHVDNNSTDIFAPNGGSGGSTVSITPNQNDGNEIATITIDGNNTKLYTGPLGGGIQFPNYTKNVPLGWLNYNSADSSWGNKVVPIAKIKFICDVCLYINANTATGYDYDPASWLIYNHNGNSIFDYSFRELRQVYIKKGECIFMRGGPKGNNGYQDQNRAFPINVDTRNIIDRYQAFMVGQPFNPRWLQINSLNADWEIIPDSPSTTDPDWNSYRPTFSF